MRSDSELKFTQKYTADSAVLQSARNDVVDCLKKIGAPTDALIDIEIALGEVLQNIVRHEFKSALSRGTNFFDIQVFVKSDFIELCITDSAHPLVDLSFMQEARSPSDIGGMGLDLIKKLTVKYSIEPLSNGNKHSLTFNGFLTPT